MKTFRCLLLLLLCGVLPRTMSHAALAAESEPKPAESHERGANEHPAGEKAKPSPKEEDFAGEEKLLHHKQSSLHTLPKSEKAAHAAVKPMPKPTSVNMKHPEQSTVGKSRPGSTLATTAAVPAKSAASSRRTVVETKTEIPALRSEGVVPLGEPTLQTARAHAGGTATLGGPMASSLKTTTAAIGGASYRGRTY
jgi:hypothetical protein